MRVRTRRFEKLRSCESRYAKVVEVLDGKDAIQACFTVSTPMPGTTGNLECQLVSCTNCPDATLDSRSHSPVFGWIAGNLSRVQESMVSEYFRGLRVTEV